jgi:hypothetical protein
MLIKMGRPDYYIPSAEMLSYNVKNRFVQVYTCISKTLKVKSVYNFHRKTLIYLPDTIGV